MAEIVPAILCPDIDCLNKKFTAISPICHHLQVDIMDGNFVSQRTIMPEDLPTLDSSFELEMHLMINNPAAFIPRLTHPAIKTVIFHLESTNDPQSVIAQIPDRFGKGLAINIDTPVEKIKPFLSDIDLALVMSIIPGAEGRKFIPESLAKINQIRSWRDDIIIEVDGGIIPGIAGSIVDNGADRLVVGKSIFTAPDMPKYVNQLRLEIGEAIT